MTKDDVIQAGLELFEHCYEQYRKEWSDPEFPITQEEYDAYKAGFADAWQAAMDYKRKGE